MPGRRDDRDVDLANLLTALGRAGPVHVVEQVVARWQPVFEAPEHVELAVVAGTKAGGGTCWMEDGHELREFLLNIRILAAFKAVSDHSLAAQSPP